MSVERRTINTAGKAYRLLVWEAEGFSAPDVPCRYLMIADCDECRVLQEHMGTDVEAAFNDRLLAEAFLTEKHKRSPRHVSPCPIYPALWDALERTELAEAAARDAWESAG